ncbi:MAG TPA: transposase, partial [Cytophagaceae bacterium]
KLSSEVKSANEARAFQKIMNFTDFQRIFPDDESCFKYLAQLKWKPNEIIRCRKCGYEKHSVLPNLSIRCGKCSYIESVTYGTLFQKLKFSILKAFYIAYLTSTSQNTADTTIAELAKEIDLRPATLWTFKQKVLALMEANKTRKKHKDGWTHLIEYSITR